MDSIGAAIALTWLVTAGLGWLAAGRPWPHLLLILAILWIATFALLSMADLIISPSLGIDQAAMAATVLTWPAALSAWLRRTVQKRKAAS